MEYINLFKELYKHNIKYLICGGLAVNIYGIPRMTADIDLLIDFSPNNIKRFEILLKDMEFQALLPITLTSLLDDTVRQQMVTDKNLIAYSFYNTKSNYMNLDVLIDVPYTFNELWEQREKRPVQDAEVFIVSLDHLIGMKKYANRTQDNQDIIMLSKLKNVQP